MTRKYSSQRRAESAEHTRQTIVEAAVRLHMQGITTMNAVAEEAGVSLPTVNKYFPTREDLFGACTSHVADSLDYPSPDDLADLRDPGERLSLIRIVRRHDPYVGVVIVIGLIGAVTDESDGLAVR